MLSYYPAIVSSHSKKKLNPLIQTPHAVMGCGEEEREKQNNMKSLKPKAKESEELEDLYEKLQRDWDAYKQSNPTESRRYSAQDSNFTIKAIQLLHNSPRHLMSQLQGSPREITGFGSERRKLKGRRLFEGESEDMSEVMRPLSFCYSEDEVDRNKGAPCLSSSSSSSSPCVFCDQKMPNRVRDSGGRVEAERRSGINGGRWDFVLLGGFAIALIIFAICIRFSNGDGGYQGIDLVPT